MGLEFWIPTIIGSVTLFVVLLAWWRGRPNLRIVMGSRSRFYPLQSGTGCQLNLVISNFSMSGNSVIEVQVTSQQAGGCVQPTSITFQQGKRTSPLLRPINLSGQGSDELTLLAPFPFPYAGDTLAVDITIKDSRRKSYSTTVQVPTHP